MSVATYNFIFNFKVRVRDAIVGGDYKILTVDSKPVERETHLFVTVVPFARVPVGKHKLKVVRHAKGVKEVTPVEITYDFKRFSSYVIIDFEGKPKIIKTNEKS